MHEVKLMHAIAQMRGLQTDDEEAAAEEGEEALRLQREQQAALRPEDYYDAHLFPGELQLQPRGSCAVTGRSRRMPFDHGCVSNAF